MCKIKNIILASYNGSLTNERIKYKKKFNARNHKYKERLNQLSTMILKSKLGKYNWSVLIHPPLRRIEEKEILSKIKEY